jgi:hypothetical protein
MDNTISNPKIHGEAAKSQTSESIEKKPITHEQAIEFGLAEQFALRQLTDEELNSFREHLLVCEECLDNTQLACEFLCLAREVLPLKKSEKKSNFLARLLSDPWPVPALVSLLFLCVTGTGIYQYAKIEDLQSPKQELRVYLTEQTRSPENRKEISINSGTQVALEAGLPLNDSFRAYRATITNEQRPKKQYVVPLRVENDTVSVTIVLPAGMPEGSYSLDIEGQQDNGKWENLKEKDVVAGGNFRLIKRITEQ